MENILCEKCNTKIKIIGLKSINSKHYILCKNCISKEKICSKTKSKKIFLLNDKDLENLKYIYIDSPNNNKFFIYQDILNIINTKYGSYENFKEIYNKKKLKLNKIREKKHKIKENRRKKLEYLFRNNKMKIKNYGDCYSYIHHGYPDLEIVLENEIKKLNEKSLRKIELGKRLNEIGLKLDESMELCYNYINQVGSKTLDETIRSIEVINYIKNSKLNNFANIFPLSNINEISKIDVNKNIEINITDMTIKFD